MAGIAYILCNVYSVTTLHREKHYRDCPHRPAAGLHLNMTAHVSYLAGVRFQSA